MFRKKQAPPPGSSPGTLAIDKQAYKPNAYVINYNQFKFEEYNVEDVQLISKLKDITWLDIQGLGDETLLREIAELFSIHPLTIADIVNIPQRPKVEDYGEYIFFVSQMVVMNEDKEIDIEQVSVVIGKSFVLTFQEKPGDVFDTIRKRIRQNKSIIRKNGSDYLGYTIIDALIDGYYPVLEVIGEQLEDLEDEVVFNPTKKTVEKIYKSKRDLLNLRRSIWPMRGALNSLIRDESKLIKKNTKIFLRDVYDHVVQVIDVVEVYRELSGSFMDIYLSSLSNKTNDIMKTLTIISTIFIPLSFLAGIYGMNFEHMPELSYKWAYPIFWCIVISIILIMLTFFYRRGWLQFGDNSNNDNGT
jgi:magnesium transporter